MTMTHADRDDVPSPSPRPRPEPETDEPGGDTSGGEPPTSGADSGATGGGRRIPKPPMGVLVGALVVLLAAAVTFGVLWALERGSAGSQQDARAAAEQLAVDLTTYDYRELDSNFDRVQEFSTEKFAKKYKGASEALGKLLAENKAISKGEVLKVGVAEFDGDRAVVLVFVDQTINNVNTKDRIDRNRMVLTLLEEDGDWKLDDVSLT